MQADVKIPHKVCLWKHKQQGYEAKQTLCAEPSAAIGLGHCQKPWDHVAALGLTNRGSLGKAPCGLYFSSLVKGVNLSQCCLLPGLWNNLTQMFWAQMKLVVSICWFTLWANICGSGHQWGTAREGSQEDIFLRRKNIRRKRRGSLLWAVLCAVVCLCLSISSISVSINPLYSHQSIYLCIYVIELKTTNNNPRQILSLWDKETKLRVRGDHIAMWKDEIKLISVWLNKVP